MSLDVDDYDSMIYLKEMIVNVVMIEPREMVVSAVVMAPRGR